VLLNLVWCWIWCAAEFHSLSHFHFSSCSSALLMLRNVNTL
jgi:hypothetical protein